MTAGSFALALVRHGESTYVAEGRFQGRHDPPLTALGERQAGLVGARIAARHGGTPLPLPANAPVGIWHSSLRRAAQTAEIIAGAQAGTVRLHATNALVELAQGDWEGQLLSDVKTRWPAELAAWRTRPAEAHAPGGEALTDAARRVATGLDDLGATLREAAATMAVEDRDPVPGYVGATQRELEPWAIVVAHDGILRIALLTLLALPIDRFWSLPFNFCCITVVGVDADRTMLRAHNLAEHLAPLADEARAAEEARGQRRGAL